MTRWKVDPLKWSGLPEPPVPFSPVHRARKFSAVLGTTSARSWERKGRRGCGKRKGEKGAKPHGERACDPAPVSPHCQSITVISMRPRGAPSASMSKKTTGLAPEGERWVKKDELFLSSHTPLPRAFPSPLSPTQPLSLTSSAHHERGARPADAAAGQAARGGGSAHGGHRARGDGAGGGGGQGASHGTHGGGGGGLRGEERGGRERVWEGEHAVGGQKEHSALCFAAAHSVALSPGRGTYGAQGGHEDVCRRKGEEERGRKNEKEKNVVSVRTPSIGFRV